MLFTALHTHIDSSIAFLPVVLSWIIGSLRGKWGGAFWLERLDDESFTSLIEGMIFVPRLEASLYPHFPVEDSFD